MQQQRKRNWVHLAASVICPAWRAVTACAAQIPSTYDPPPPATSCTCILHQREICVRNPQPKPSWVAGEKAGVMISTFSPSRPNECSTEPRTRFFWKKFVATFAFCFCIENVVQFHLATALGAWRCRFHRQDPEPARALATDALGPPLPLQDRLLPPAASPGGSIDHLCRGRMRTREPNWFDMLVSPEVRPSPVAPLLRARKTMRVGKTS